MKTASRKSQVDFYVDLVEKLMMGIGATTQQESKSILRDILTLRKRVSQEGLSFLTKTLPKLGKCLDEALVSGRLNIPRELGFTCKRRTRRHGLEVTPAFMQGCFSRLFDSKGVLLAHAHYKDVQHIRQVCFAAYKLEADYTPDEEAEVIRNFVQTEVDLAGFEFSERAIHRIVRASELTKRVFGSLDPKDILPRHGPGAVATGEEGVEKWHFSRKYDAIHQVYPYYEYFVVGRARELLDRRGWYTSLERHESGTARVCLVPKDSRGPRLISCEPLEYQWVQQGLSRKLVEHLEQHPLTRGRVNFTDQEINGKLALSSSLDKEYATLDLKDASDRVTTALVCGIFQEVPTLLSALMACRTTATQLPPVAGKRQGEVIPLWKFAPMGSALCFPVMAWTAWVVIVAAVEQVTRLPLQRVAANVFVYGDDIVVPTSWARIAIGALESVGLKVNNQKSCTKGNFRESCGIDAFKGHCVTPSRIRQRWTRRKSDGRCLYGYAALANDLRQKGYTDAARFIWDSLASVYGPLPKGTTRCGFPCEVCPSPLEALVQNLVEGRRWRWNSDLQRYEFYVSIVKDGRRPLELDGWPRALRSITSKGLRDPSHEVVPRSSKIKRGWAAVY